MLSPTAQIISNIMPLAADALTAWFYADALRAFRQLFQETTLTNGWIILGIFATLCLGIFAYKKTEEDTENETHAIFGYPTMGFAILVILMTVQSINLSEITDPTEDKIAMTMMGIGILLLIAFMGVIFSDIKQTRNTNLAGFFSMRIFSLLSVVVAIWLSGAYFETAFFENTPTDTDLNSMLLKFSWMYPIFILFFASPRLVFLSKNFTWYSLLSALVSMGYYVWHSLKFIAL